MSCGRCGCVGTGQVQMQAHHFCGLRVQTDGLCLVDAGDKGKNMLTLL